MKKLILIALLALSANGFAQAFDFECAPPPKDGSTIGLAIETQEQWDANRPAIHDGSYLKNSATGDIIVIQPVCSEDNGNRLILIAYSNGNTIYTYSHTDGSWGFASDISFQCLGPATLSVPTSGLQAIVSYYIENDAINYRLN